MRDLAENEGNQRDHGNSEADENRIRREPVILLALVENILQESNSDDDKSDAHIVDAEVGFDHVPEICGVADNSRRERKRKNANRHVDKEDPVPTEIVSDVSSERGTDGRRHQDGHAIHSEPHATLLCRKCVSEDGLFSGLQSAASGALKNAEEDEHGQACGQST